MIPVLRVPIDADARECLTRTVIGDGGFQRLLKQLQVAAIRGPGGVITGLELREELLEKVVRYSEEYGDGGFQGRLGGLLKELRAFARVLSPLDDGGAQPGLFGGNDGDDAREARAAARSKRRGRGRQGDH